jgi:nitrate reductase molybdenum cofactor assembly chaperone NarJ/NarW
VTGGGDRDVALVHQAASVLLGYPDHDVLGRLGVVRAAVADLPRPLREPLVRALDGLTAADPHTLAADYVATFDIQRRACLYLTYYTHGDTRKRGMALLLLKHRYRQAGFDLADDELPDFLPLVLEFAAADPRVGREILLAHRAGLDVLAAALRQQRSRYADVVDAVIATLPAATPRALEQARRLVAEGPPREEVGLEPFAPPEPMGVSRR